MFKRESFLNVNVRGTDWYAQAAQKIIYYI